MNLRISISAFLMAGGMFGASLASAAEPTPASYALCAACHGPDGTGVKVGALLMAPTLHKSALVNDGDGEVLASIIITGIQKEDQKYMGMMAPLGAAMNPAQLTEVMNFLRQNFDNKAEPITEEQAKGWVEKYSGKPSRKRKDLAK